MSIVVKIYLDDCATRLLLCFPVSPLALPLPGRLKAGGSTRWSSTSKWAVRVLVTKGLAGLERDEAFLWMTRASTIRIVNIENPQGFLRALNPCALWLSLPLSLGSVRTSQKTHPSA